MFDKIYFAVVYSTVVSTYSRKLKYYLFNY